MLLIVLFLCVATSVFVTMRRGDTLSLYLLGMSVSNSLMLFGVIIYIAKIGGIAATKQIFLFLLPGIQRWLQYLPISMSLLGYVVAVGRTLFPWFLFQVGLEVSMIPWVRRRHKLLRNLSAIVPVLFLVYYWPDVFYTLVRGRFWLITAMIPLSMAWILAYLAAALLLMVQEYRATTIPFFRRNLGYILLAAGGITALYLLYATKDPAQIYNMFIGEYIRLGITSYISPTMPMVGWIILGSCTVFFLVLGSYGMILYTQLDYAEGREDISLQRKFDAAGTGVSVFVHGIKNQLLSSRVLHKKLSRALEAETPDLDQVRDCAAALRELNEGMLTRMDELYRTVKNSALSLSPVPVGQVAAGAVERFHGKYPEVEVTVDLPGDRLVLADQGPLSEAVYNLLTNGCEAAIQAGREPELALRVRAERLWTVLEVRDNGGGIPPELQSKIYEPFFTSKNTNYNWGMGLYYVRRIVKSHFGRLRLESRMGEGNASSSCSPSLTPDAGGDENDRKKIRVMVAEDIPLLLEDFCDTVSRAGDMEVAGAALSGQEITQLARERDCDVILMDIEMETMQAGIIAAENIHRQKPEVKIIFLTAHETEDFIISAMASGAVDYVVKGCEDGVLLEHIRNAYHDRTTLEQHIHQVVMREYSRLHQSERSLIFFISNVARLTPAERELVRLLLRGLKIQEIAAARCVEVVTVKTQIKGLLNKFGCTRTKEIVAMIRQLGLEHLFQ